MWSLLWELYDYGIKVRDGIVNDDSFLPIIYGLNQDEDWTTEENWRKAMPALGDFCDIGFIREEFEKAKVLPSREIVFRTLYLNQFVDNVAAFIPNSQWQACKSDEVSSCRNCVAALDLSTKTDLTSFVLFFDDLSVKPFFWLPSEATKQRAAGQKQSLDTWIRQGFIETCDGNLVDYQQVRRKIKELGQQYSIRYIAIDPWNVGNIGVELMQDGFRVEYFTQSFGNYNSPCKELQGMVLQRTIKHDGNPVLSWQMNQLKVAKDSNGNLRPCKKSSTDSIDGACSLLMAIGLYNTKPRASIYETSANLSI